ncbi:hypothetical protein ABZP36_018146 [Zizania latifolia]
MTTKLRSSFLVLLIASVATVPHVVTVLDPGADPLSPDIFPVALSLAGTPKPFDLAVLRWNSVVALEIRARSRPLIGILEHLAPPLQFLTNACVVFFLIQSIDWIVLCLGCFWIRLKGIKPVPQATGGCLTQSLVVVERPSEVVSTAGSERAASAAVALPPKRIYTNNGYLMVSCNDGLNQMRAVVCLSVDTSPYINCKSVCLNLSTMRDKIESLELNLENQKKYCCLQFKYNIITKSLLETKETIERHRKSLKKSQSDKGDGNDAESSMSEKDTLLQDEICKSWLTSIKRYSDIPSSNGGKGFALDSIDRTMEANTGDKTSKVFAADSCTVDNNGVAEEEAPALMEFEDDCTTGVDKNTRSWNVTSEHKRALAVLVQVIQLALAVPIQRLCSVTRQESSSVELEPGYQGSLEFSFRSLFRIAASLPLAPPPSAGRGRERRAPRAEAVLEDWAKLMRSSASCGRDRSPRCIAATCDPLRVATAAVLVGDRLCRLRPRRREGCASQAAGGRW